MLPDYVSFSQFNKNQLNWKRIYDLLLVYKIDRGLSSFLYTEQGVSKNKNFCEHLDHLLIPCFKMPTS